MNAKMNLEGTIEQLPRMHSEECDQHLCDLENELNRCKLKLEITYVQILGAVELVDPDCPDSGAYLDGHCDLSSSIRILQAQLKEARDFHAKAEAELMMLTEQFEAEQTAHDEPTKIDFNVNNTFWVRLTDEGRRIYAQRQTTYPDAARAAPFELDGWSEWQLWQLMQTFGEHMYNGCNVPFETTIQIQIGKRT